MCGHLNEIIIIKTGLFDNNHLNIRTVNSIKQIINNSVKLLLILILSIYCYTTTGQSNQYRFKQLNKIQGLSNNQVKCIYKDSYGFMWFGTASGLNRFDGYTIKTFRYNKDDTTTISDDFIMNITEDHLGRLWIKAMNNYNIFDNISETFIRNATSRNIGLNITEAVEITDIIKDRDGNYFYLFEGYGILKYIVSKDTLISYNHNPLDSSTISYGIITSILEDSVSNYWLINRKGLIEKFDKRNEKVIYRNDLLVQTYDNSNLEIKSCMDLL